MKELVFEKKGGWSVCEITEYTPGCVVQLTLGSTGGKVLVEANAPGMEPHLLETITNPWDRSVMLELAVPEGLEICIKTRSEVVAAMIV